MTNVQDLAHWLSREGANCQKHIDCADAIESLTKELEAEQGKSAKARLHEMDNIRLTTERDDLGDDLAQAKRYIVTLTAERDALEVECEKIKMDWSQDAARLTAENLELTAEMADQGPCINGLRDKVSALGADAARYRWLREAATEELEEYATVMPGQFDDYVDASIAKESKT